MKIFCGLLLFFQTLALFSGELRVVSLSPALTELVCHLGRGDRLVGRSEVCNFPSEVKSLPVVGRFADPDVEAVIALKPTLLVTNDLVKPGVVAAFRRAGIQTAVLQCRTIAEYRSCVETLGKLLQAETAAGREIARIDRESAARPSPLPCKVLWVIWDSPLMIAGANSLPDEMLRFAGVENVAADVPQAYFKCSFDWLLERQIDAIVWMASPNGWKKHRFWKKLPAVQANHILADLDPDLLQRPGPRIFDGLKMLRKRLEALP